MPPLNTPDYYEVLQVSPRADQATIERVYRLLAKRYHPDNTISGNEDKFSLLTEAFRELSDPEKRAAYDARQDNGNGRSYALFLNAPSSGGAEEDRRIYQAVLSILYNARRQDANNAAVGVVHLEKMLDVPEKHLEFHIWYLKEKKWIERNENGGFVITASGVDEVIKEDLLLQRTRLLPFNHETPAPSDKAPDEASPSSDTGPA